MTTAISRLFIVEAKVVFTRSTPDEPLDRALRSAAEAVGEVYGAPFQPKGSRSVRFLSGVGTAGRIELEHPQFTRQSGRGNSWLSLSVERHHDPGFGLLFMGVHMGRPEEQIDVEWDIGLQIMPRLIERLTPRLAHLNGRLVDLERAVFPREAWVGGTSLPKSFTPWTFFDAESLDAEVRRKLGSLPVPAHLDCA